MFDPDVLAFLSEGTRTAKLCYLASDGRPLVAPVWFLVEGDEIVCNTGADTAKGRALRRDRRVSICVDLEEPPYGFVQIQGEAVLVDADPDEIRRTATAIAARYVGSERADDFGARNGVPGELVVRIRPRKVIAHFDMTA